MEALLVILAIIGLFVWFVLSKFNKWEEEEKQKQVAIQQRAQDEKALQKELTGADTPEKILALCPYEPPRSIRLLKTEKPLWVLPECTYVKTVKEVTYSGGSTGASFRIAKGVSVRTSGSRGRRQENESMEAVDKGTAVLTDKHLYFAGTDKERFRVRLDKLVVAEAVEDGFLFQRDTARARPEALASNDAYKLAVILSVVENDYKPDFEPETESAESDDGVDVIAAHQANMN